jgi:hypothetical protein
MVQQADTVNIFQDGRVQAAAPEASMGEFNVKREED